MQLLLGSYGKLPQAQTVNSDSLQSVKLPAGLSSQILCSARILWKLKHALMAANANIGAARAAFFPSISLTSGISTASSDLSSLFNASSGMWNFIPKIEIPIFNAGRNQANLDIAEIRQQQSVVNYEQKIQNAFKEVADALALRQSLNDQISAPAALSGVAANYFATGAGIISARRGKLSGSAGCRAFFICNPTNFTRPELCPSG
ncbi:copper/silver efflux system outer membrane protein CusC [Escherichia coli]|uniref:Copper/silver efflux system outer membrane protein CusC n=1 Tax=Escherichia coli TaxID=562 RepID=A0A376UFD7_ECOLX|nr:copper/silver efflux system outer membrane protein CusC [Escherichia coli]